LNITVSKTPFPLEEHISYLVASAHRKLHSEMATQLNAFGVRVEKWRILEILNKTESSTMSDLARLALMNPPTLTKMVDRMVADGLVQRQINHYDQRSITLLITALGLDLVKKIRQPAIYQNSTLVEKLGSEKANLVREALETLNELL
tara:strand:- start:6 stop:449 length:444 start_codon:yes stop_codon:yes gene_type:complete